MKRSSKSFAELMQNSSRGLSINDGGFRFYADFSFSSPEGIEALWRAGEEKERMRKYVPASIGQVNTLLLTSPTYLARIYERP